MTVWDGEGSLSGHDVLTCPFASFLSMGVQQGDIVVLIDGPTELRSDVLQVDSETSLILGNAEIPYAFWADSGRTDLLKVRVERRVADPCQICKEQGSVAESDHVHCLWCRKRRDDVTLQDIVERRPVKMNCPACLAYGRKKLAEGNDWVETFKLFGGKRVVKLKARTVNESDGIQEYQDSLVIDNPKLSAKHVLDESAKASLAVSLLDDGTGKKPLDLVKEDTPDEPTVRLPIMMKHFKGINSTYYMALMQALHRFDVLIEESCQWVIEDKVKGDELLELAEALATSPTVVTGKVDLWDGFSLTMASPPQDALDEANAFAENFTMANREKLLDGRTKFIVALARLAAIFRGDGKMDFDEESAFEDRLGYLMSLPLPLYYLYIAASNVWSRRTLKASEFDTLGNF